MIKYESDLYEPVKRLFENNGYEVKGEIKNCDLVALKDNEMIVCELKKCFNLKLVYQLLDRKSISPLVYGATVTPKKDIRSIKKLVKAIDCGLIFVSEETGIAEVVLNPQGAAGKKGNKTARVKREFEGRSFDNIGGVNKTRLMTAYKEQSIRLLCYLEILEEASPGALRSLGFNKNVGNVLYQNFYGWFSRIRKGVYGLSEEGRLALDNAEYSQQVEYFRREMEDKNVQTIKK